MNAPFADIYCEKDGKSFIISVKTRNKYQKNGKLNDIHNLGTNAYEKVKKSSQLLSALHLECGAFIDFHIY